MPATIEVRFKGNRKEYFHWPEEAEPLRLRDGVIVAAERGQDFGRVSAVGESATKKCASCSGCSVGEVKPPERPVLRRASQDDIRTANDLRRTEEETRRTVMERVRSRGLEMKVSDAEWQWDRKKLTIYFTAEKRVDFRELVRDLASVLHTRIDLRQIGARDEAARLGGVGRCGKEYCCSSWLTELSPVSLALAKDQHLSLNPAQISGGCGRLLCCLKYEHEFYVTARKQFPKEGKLLKTSRGAERVVAIDIFRERVFLRSEEEGPRIITLADLRSELEQAGEPPPEARGIPSAPRPQGDKRPAPGRGARRPVREAPRGAAPAAPTPPAPVPPPPPVPPPVQEIESAGDEGDTDEVEPSQDTASPAGVPPRRRRRRRRRRGGGGGGGSGPGTPGAPPAGS